MGCASSSKDVFEHRHGSIGKNTNIFSDRLLHDQTGTQHPVIIIKTLLSRYFFFIICIDESTILVEKFSATIGPTVLTLVCCFSLDSNIHIVKCVFFLQIFSDPTAAVIIDNRHEQSK